MVSSFQVRRRLARNLPAKLLAGVAVVLLALGYIYFLKVEDAGTATDFATLRHGDSVHYLETVRHRKGFRSYMSAVSREDGYAHYNSNAPEFLIGRWALFTRPQRVNSQFIAENCSNSLTFEDGEVKASGKTKADYRARYRITGSTVDAKLGDGKVMPVSMVSYGMDLHHIVVTLPGKQEPLYGYLCK